MTAVELHCGVRRAGGKAHRIANQRRRGAACNGFFPRDHFWSACSRGAIRLQQDTRENTRSARHDHSHKLQSRNSDASPGRHSIRALGFPADARYKAPWLAWFGGAYGAVALLSPPTAAPRLWAAMYIG